MFPHTYNVYIADDGTFKASTAKSRSAFPVQLKMNMVSSFTTDTYVFYSSNEMQIANFLLKQPGFYNYIKKSNHMVSQKVTEFADLEYLLRDSSRHPSKKSFVFIGCMYHQLQYIGIERMRARSHRLASLWKLFTKSNI